jgi:hypothetical protein
LAAVLALAAAFAACSGSDRSFAPKLPDVRLPTLAGIPGPSLASCPTDKCLTVLVAPWCPVCHRSASSIVLLRRFLDEHGVASRVVVGASDDAAAIKKFASVFGPDALLDEGGALDSRGVPAFFVTDRQGRLLKSVPGFPRASGPEELARDLDLI